MRKAVLCLLMAGAFVVPPAAASETLLRKPDKVDRIETYLPAATTHIPWLNLDSRTKLPKGDYPIGRDVSSIEPLILRPQLHHADLVGSALGGS